MKLQVDEEFSTQIPPLTDEEFEQLEENILSDGRIISPIITWNGFIVDGHNGKTDCAKAIVSALGGPNQRLTLSSKIRCI